MKSQKMKIGNSIFNDSQNEFWNSEPLNISDSEFKEDFFLFFSKKKQSYKNKPLKRSGGIIIKTKKNGQIKWCDVTNAFLEMIELQHVGSGLRITKNGQSLEFFGYLENWTRDLKKFCIQTQIKQQFIISNKLGCGSFANVHRIIRKSDSKEFAAKIYDKQLEQFDKESVIKELEILRKMDHPNVITVLETFESQQYLFIVTEQFNFGNLDAMLMNSQISEEEALKGMYKILDALASIHSKGVIHRDIKPENILFRKPNLEDLIVSDFGLADFYNREGLYKYHRCGTPGNIAPEVLKDQPYDLKVDTYSAGIIFYQMMAQGKSPFIVEDLQETLNRNEFGLIDFSILNASPPTKSLIQQMLELDPNKRCTTQEAKNNIIFKKFNRQTIVIKRKRLPQDQTVSSYSPRSNSIYQSTSNQPSPPIQNSPYSKFIGPKNLHTIPLRLRSHERKLFSSPSSCNSSGANQNLSQRNKNQNFKINMKNNKTSIYFAMNSNKAI